MNAGQKDQAEALRQVIQEASEKDTLQDEEKQGSVTAKGQEETVIVDILNLPPRKEVHKDAGKMRLKMNFSLFRLIFIIVLLIILVGGMFWYLEPEGLFTL